MENMSIELCPICIENPGINFTECNHGFCISCLCRIKKCAICRNPLQRVKICLQIQEKFNLNEITNHYNEVRTFMEIVLPEITYIRRRHNITTRPTIIRIPRWQTVRD